jgi:hypothetical protein
MGVTFMVTTFGGTDRQPQATTGNRSSNRELALHGIAQAEPLQMLPAVVMRDASFSQVLQFAAQHSGFDDEEIAKAVCVCKGYFSRFMRGVAQQWAKRLVAFMRTTNSLGPLQWIADQVGCDVTHRDMRAAEVAALQSRLRELGQAA